MTQTQAINNVSADYNTIRPWLISIGARTMWSMKGPKDTAIKTIESYLIGKTLVIFQSYKDIGWEFYVQASEGHIGTCLAQLEALSKAKGA